MCVGMNGKKFHPLQYCGDLILGGLVLAIPVSSSAETNRFFYDGLGRVAVVIGTNQSDAAFYKYDAVGNITQIVRQTVGAVNLFVFTPVNGMPGQIITLQGTGFSSTPSENTVRFGTITAEVASASANELRVLVPTNASASLLNVITPSGASTNDLTFTLAVGVVVSPAAVTLSVPVSTQFVATVYGTNDQSVVWTINGVIPATSNSLWGTVSTSGLYSSPTNAPLAGQVSIRARSVAVASAEGAATVTIVTPFGPILSPTVGVQPGTPTDFGPIYSSSVGVQPGTPTEYGPIYSPTVSVGPTP